VRTKFGKTFIANFLPVGQDMLDIFRAYVEHLRSELLWGPEDPLFPATRQGVGAAHKFETLGLERRPWADPAAARGTYKAAFGRAGVPYHPPHSIRTTLVNLAQRVCTTPEEFKVFSQVLGHEEPLTTWRSYGYIEPQRQAQVMADLRSRTGKQKSKISDEMVGAIVAVLEKHGSLETR
jgi:integrase